MSARLTFMEKYIWSNLGWVFCEISFRCPERLWHVLGVWTNTLGNWFYDRAYTRTDIPVGGGGTGPF